MIDRDEYTSRVMNSLRHRRLIGLHNGEKGPSISHVMTCPCATTPHTPEEIGLLATIENSLTTLLRIWEQGAIERAGEWNVTTSTK